MGLSRLEQETCITFNEAEPDAWVHTHRRALWRELERRGLVAEREDVLEGRVVAKAFRVPKDWIRIRPPRRVTTAQRAASRRNMRRLRAAGAD